jgi:DNA polymerase III epsilon subunit-like protein
MIYFDLETTGLNPETDRICQFYALRDDGYELHFLCDPEMHVSTDAGRAHGYTWTDLKKHPPFKHFARDVQLLFKPDEVIVGYNSRTFDTMLLHAELQRVGERGLLTDPATDDIVQPEIDIFKLWLNLERRTLEGCARRFGVNIPADGKYHDARTDVLVLPRILLRMEEEFGVDASEMMALVVKDEVDRAGKFRRNKAGEVVFNFGKFRDGRAFDQPGYLRWMLEKGESFHPSTLSVARAILREKGQLA